MGVEPAPGRTRVHVVVRGRVQGVCFRAETRRRADTLGLAGWVRNRPDGSVEAVLEGDAGHVDEMLEWCRRGPNGAEVRSVDVSWEPPTRDRGFEVL